MSESTSTREATEAPRLVGQPIPRVEDDRLLRGQGRFVDDVVLPDALHIAFLRSPHAHARIRSLDMSAAEVSPGVVAVYDGRSLLGVVEPLVNIEEVRVPPGLVEGVAPIVKIQPMPPLAHDEVNYVGQPMVMVVAESRYLAEDAIEEILVDYEPLPVVTDPERALDPDSPLALLEADDNIGLQAHISTGDMDAAIAGAHVVLEETFASQRYVPSPMETRGVVATIDPYSARLQMWSNTQTPHRVRDHVAHALGISTDDVTVTTPDVGGGFGQKGILIVEEILVPFAARDLGRTVRWQADRTENLVADTHAREQIHHLTIAADADGRLLGVRDRCITNMGCRNVVGLVVAYNALVHLTGAYRVPALDLELVGSLTNTMFTAPYRGAGRPEAAFAMERAMDRLAVRLGKDPAEVRRVNLLTEEDMPYFSGLLDRRGLPQEIDTGDYVKMLDMVEEMIDFPAFREEQERLRGTGVHRGVGLGMYIEMSGLGPFESARATVLPSGTVRVSTGSPSQGQGHATSFVQVAADALDVPMDDIELVGGDTHNLQYGVGTIASRAMVTAGNAIDMACRELHTQIERAAAGLHGVAPDDVTLESGKVMVAGVASMTLAELVRALTKSPSDDPSAGLSAHAYFKPPNYATSSGLHAAVVEVDTATGATSILDYVVVHEAGNIVNPTIADGQILGGAVQGIGGALLEHLQYDDNGQPTTATYMDYLMPTVETVPEIRLGEVFYPTPTNRLGVKGLGEGGAVGPQAAIANAVEDALRPYGVVVRATPVNPDHIRRLLRESAAATPAGGE